MVGILTGIKLIKKKDGIEKIRVGELLPLEQFILLKVGDKLSLTKEPILGESAKYDELGNLIEPAHVSCTLPKAYNKPQYAKSIKTPIIKVIFGFKYHIIKAAKK